MSLIFWQGRQRVNNNHRACPMLKSTMERNRERVSHVWAGWSRMRRNAQSSPEKKTLNSVWSAIREDAFSVCLVLTSKWGFPSSQGEGCVFWQRKQQMHRYGHVCKIVSTSGMAREKREGKCKTRCWRGRLWADWEGSVVYTLTL